MCLISPLDDDLALVYPRLAPVRLLELLAERGIGTVEVPDEEFATMGPNVLALGPRRALALEGNDETRRRMERAGVDVVTYRGDEISRKGDGGPTCLTRPLLARLESGRVRASCSTRSRRATKAWCDELVAARPELRRRPMTVDGLSAVLRALYAGQDEVARSLLDANPRSTSSTRPRSVGRAGSRSSSTASRRSRGPGRPTASRPSTSPRSSGRRTPPRCCSSAAPT